MRYIDAILHIASLPDLIGFMAANAPDKLDASGRITGFDTATMVASGVAGLVYVRMTAADAETFRVTPRRHHSGRGPVWRHSYRRRGLCDPGRQPCGRRTLPGDLAAHPDQF